MPLCIVVAQRERTCGVVGGSRLRGWCMDGCCLCIWEAGQTYGAIVVYLAVVLRYKMRNVQTERKSLGVGNGLCDNNSDQKWRTSFVLAGPGCDSQPQVAVDAMRTCVSPFASNWRPLRILRMTPRRADPPSCSLHGLPKHDDGGDDKKKQRLPRF